MPPPTSDPMTDRETLNAYVDGELDPAQAAEVAERISRNPALAREVATLTRLKGAASAAFDTSVFVPILTEPARPRRWRTASAAAAAIVLLVATGLAVWQEDRPASPVWLNAALLQHDTMAKATATDRLQPAALAVASNFQPFIPDLAAARLQPVAAVPFLAGNGAATAGIAIHFRGTRGCKLSYFAFMLGTDETTLGEALALLDPRTTQGHEGHAWRVGEIGYVLLARGMDTGRLSTLAEMIHAASRKHRPLDEAARSQLAQNRAASRPCVA